MSDVTTPKDRDLDRLDIEEVKRFLARRWKLVVASAIVCVVLAGVACVMMTPVYTATSQVLLDPRKQHVFGQDTVNPDAALDSSIVDSQIPIILSTRLLAKVIAKENLAADPEFASPSQPGLLDRVIGIFRPAHGGKVELPSFDGIDPKLAPIILRLFNKVDVSRVAKSYVLSISVSSRDPAKAMRLANSLSETYVEDQIDVRARSVQQTATFFETRLGRLREQVRESERAVADFRKANNLTTTTMDGKITVGEQQLQALNEELAKVSADTAEKLAKFQQAVRFKSNGSNLETLPEVIRSPVIVQLRAQQADLSRRESDLSAMYGPAYPAITQIRAQRVGLDRAMSAEMKRLTSTLKNDYEVAKAREDGLRKTIAGLTDVSGGDNDVGVKLRELERANLANKALFENFLNRAKLTQEQSTFEEPDARLISPALEPTSPASPKIKLILPVAGVAGLLLGLGIAAVLDMRRPKSGVPRPRLARKAPAREPEDANPFILGRVPAVDLPPGDADLVAFLEREPGSSFAASIERLKGLLLSPAGKARDGHVFALLPLKAGEGATSLARCLAAAAGRAGRRVLLIDADRGGRGLTHLMGTAGRPGLAEVVRGEVVAGKAVIRQPLFAFLPVGHTDHLRDLDVDNLRAFLAETRGRFDVVLVDGPAFVVDADAAAVAAVCDGFAIVASREQLMRETFISAIDDVADQSAFAGIILNGVAEPAEAALAEAG